MENDMVLRIAFVSERQYPALKRVCEPEVVGRNYADYLMIINEYREESRMLGIPFEIIRINPETFALWCGKKKASWADLLRYAGSTFPANPPANAGSGNGPEKFRVAASGTPDGARFPV
jgi:hypothetical protein